MPTMDYFDGVSLGWALGIGFGFGFVDLLIIGFFIYVCMLFLFEKVATNHVSGIACQDFSCFKLENSKLDVKGMSAAFIELNLIFFVRFGTIFYF